MEHFVEVYRRRGLKVNAGRGKVMLLGGEEGMKCEVFVDGTHLEHLWEFKYLGCILDETDTDEAEYCRKVARGTKVTSVIRSLVNARDLQFERDRVLHE